MNIEIKPEETGGEIYIPPSKSVTHRAIFAASLANGTSRIKHVLLSQDIKATIEAVKAFGAEITVEPEEQDGLFTLLVTGNPEPFTKDVLIDCIESGSTVRFLIPIIALDSENTVITGKNRLKERPLNVYTDIFDQQGFSYEQDSQELPIILNGQLKPGLFELRGDISSQFITGLLFALPLLEDDSVISLTTQLESKPYVELTIQVLAEFGIEIERVNESEYFIPGNQNYRPSRISIHGDYSQAAFWFVNGLINNKTILKNLNQNSIQGDYQIISILNDHGGYIQYEQEDHDFISLPSKTEAFTVDVSNIPDLVPILSIVAALSEGTSYLVNAKRLRLKESDRIESTFEMLKSFGVEVEVIPDGLKIVGQNSLTSATIDSFNDHRIAIAAAIASGRADGPVIIQQAQCVNKSYPNFWNDFESVGGVYYELDMGE